MLNINLKNNYKPYENITVDEQLFPFRGRTKFTQYIPSKPAKYGIKIWWACEAKTHFPLECNIYTSREQGQIKAEKQGENEIMRLVMRYKDSGRTIVADNFFTTLDLCKNKAVILLSTVHYDTSVAGIKKKPEAIMHYNKTKTGVDVMDQMLGKYTTKRRTNRWTLAIFYNMIDVMGLASYI